MDAASTLDARWAAFSRDACAARVADAQARACEKSRSASNPEAELARRLWTLGCRFSTRIVDLLRIMQDHRYGEHIEHIERALDRCTDEWEHYRQRIRQHPAIHKRYFISHEPDPLVQNGYTDRVFSHVRLDNLTSSRMWEESGFGVPSRPQMLCRLASAMRAIQESVAAQPTMSFVAEREAKKRAERQARFDKVHEGQDREAGSVDALAAQLADTCRVVQGMRDTARATHQREARQSDAARAQLAALQEQTNQVSTILADLATNIGRAAKSHDLEAGVALRDFMHGCVDATLNELERDTSGTPAERKARWKTMLGDRIRATTAALVDNEDAVRLRKQAVFRHVCVGELLRELPRVLALALACRPFLPDAADVVVGVTTQDLHELQPTGPPPPDSLPDTIQHRHEAVARSDAWGLCAWMLDATPTVDARIIATLRARWIEVQHGNVPFGVLYRGIRVEEERERDIVRHMSLADTLVLENPGRNAPQLLQEYVGQLRGVVRKRLDDCLAREPRPTVASFRDTPIAHAGWYVDTALWESTERAWWKERALAISAGASVNETLHAEAVARAAASIDPPTFGELCHAWLALWALAILHP